MPAFSENLGKGILYMTKKNDEFTSNLSSSADIFQPRSGLRNSTLWQDGKPDARLVKLIHLLAQATALEHFETECAASKGKKKSKKLGAIKK